jgi:hypothetical protein
MPRRSRGEGCWQVDKGRYEISCEKKSSKGASFDGYRENREKAWNTINETTTSLVGYDSRL